MHQGIQVHVSMKVRSIDYFQSRPRRDVLFPMSFAPRYMTRPNRTYTDALDRVYSYLARRKVIKTRSSKAYRHPASPYTRMCAIWHKDNPCLDLRERRLRWKSLQLRFIYRVNVLRSFWQALFNSRATGYIHLHKPST